MAKLLGSYKLEKNENLDAFYSAAGVPWIARKMMLMSSPTVHVSKEKNDENDEEMWLIRTISFTRTMDLSFKLNEPFEDELPSGDVYETVAKMEGDSKFILESSKDDDASFIREYEFSEDGLVMTMKLSGVEAKRYFKRVEA